MKDFRNLKVWEKAHAMALKVYKITKDFPRDELYGITSQMRKAAVSVQTTLPKAADAELMETSHDSFRLPWVQRMNLSIFCSSQGISYSLGTKATWK